MATDTRPTSTQAVITTLIANLALCGAFVGAFIILRIKFKRIYSPRSSLDIVDESKRPPELPKDPIRWIFILLGRSHSQIIEYVGLDGYFFLRYLFNISALFFMGVLTYTVLLPINATDGRGNTGFDKLSISNVKNPDRYYAHVFIGWIFYGLVIFIIYRELFLYNSLRLAALSSPKYAEKLSSRVVLFQSVPDTLLDEKQFFKMFNGVKRIYIVRNARKLGGKVRIRDGLLNKLEAAENKLLKLAVKNKMKADKKGNPIEGTDINDYVPESKRPKFKPDGMFGKKVDTINYCLEQIPKLNKEIRSLQKQYRSARPKNSLFVEFENQYTAQIAYQTAIHHNPLRMTPVSTGMEPGDVIWHNLRMFWWEKSVRSTIACCAIAAVVILWAIPVAFVGVISNLTYITNKLPWLKFIYKLPKTLLGLITGLLPTIMLSILLAMLPIFIRGMASVAGASSVQKVELFSQNAYFSFLIVNSFIVITLASSATSVVTQIIEDPTSSLNLLAQNLPKASNFFISYIILQGLLITGSTLFQVVGLFLYYILGFFLDSTLRKKWLRYSSLDGMVWGTLFPVYTNLAVITLAYSIISPMILIFSAFAFMFVFIAFSYNISYVHVEGPDVRGLHYPRALFQTFTGIYLGQICLLGMFVVGKGWGPIVLQAIGLGFTVFCHMNLKQSFDKLIKVIPIDVMRPLDGISETPSFQGQTDYKVKVIDKKRHQFHRTETEELLNKAINEENQINDKVKQDMLDDDIEMQQNVSNITPLLADRDNKKLESNNLFIQFFRPDVFHNFRHAKKLLPATYNISPEQTDDPHAYSAPVASAKPMTVWIPKDPMGLSKIEIENAKGAVEMSDENSSFNEKGGIIFLGPSP